ncbi:unnamed protein product [Lymnaea stagnalis]|uniref:Folate receptor-like domain-containing protein n=1 Tax=Lymnaea stagnalis TaxID=6523 RepID=A0AAV2I9F8_LYMST
MLAALFVILGFLLLAESRLDSLKTVEEYMNICLDGNNHKSAPGPMDAKAMEKFCTPWSQRSCCTEQVAQDMHIHPQWLNFNWDHCRQLSPPCREQFLMDLCFYECSPNVGPWLIKDERKIRKERFQNVPLCQSVCTNWWQACKNDFTCLDNWAVSFNWSTGINTCPEGKQCKPFHQIFKDSNHFCENLMGNSFKVVSDTEDCFLLWFDADKPNPNERVARKKASEILGLPFSDSLMDGSGSESCYLASFNVLLFGLVNLVFKYVSF